jgi:hypothetical protein
MIEGRGEGRVEIRGGVGQHIAEKGEGRGEVAEGRAEGGDGEGRGQRAEGRAESGERRGEMREENKDCVEAPKLIAILTPRRAQWRRVLGRVLGP